ncbi:MAG: alpha/beta hydrolase [Prevotella sp.]|nr:alpha/beta hydrolase [Prevotella sp.]
MRKTLLFAAVMAMMAATVQAQGIAGTWHGQLDLQVMKLNLVFHFSKEKCTLDSPDQGAKGIAGEIKELDEKKVDAAFPSIGAAFSGDLKDGKIVGTFRQMGRELPLTLTAGELVRLRPQTPQPPYPYETREVTFKNDEANATLAGTLTLPANFETLKKRTVVLMVTGSGLQNRDEELFDHKPFAVIADYLARHDIASLRYDDRGFGQSTGDVANATTADFAQDAEAGIHFLRSMNFSEKNGKKTREKPMFSKVGILGHSEGGSVAFMLGAQQAVDFIVALAAPGIKGDTLLVEQTNALLQLSGQPAKMTLKQMRLTMAMQETNPWYDFFTEYDPADDIKATKCPVFALNGSLDKQVLPESNLNAIYNLQSTIYNSKPNTQHLTPNTQHPTIKLYPGLNHLFQHATTGATTEYNHIEETISEEVLRDIAEWIGNLQ